MIRAEQIPMEVKLRLRAILHDGETDEARALAAALSAWPGAQIVEEREDMWAVYLEILPLSQEPRDE